MKKRDKTFYDYISFMQSLGAEKKRRAVAAGLLTLRGPIPIYEKEAFAEYLSHMAAKGWIFTDFDTSWRGDTGVGRLIFTKGEGRELKYCLDAFRQYGCPGSGEYISTCEASGWSFVARAGNIYVFCSDEESALPLQSDIAVEAGTMALLRPPVSRLIAAAGMFLAACALCVFFTVMTYINDPLAYYLDNALIIGIPLLLLAGGILLGRGVINRIKFSRAMRSYRMSLPPVQHGFRRLARGDRAAGIAVSLTVAAALLTTLVSALSGYKYANVRSPISLSDFTPVSRYGCNEIEGYRGSVLAEEVFYEESECYVDHDNNKSMTIYRYVFATRGMAADAYSRDPIFASGDWFELSDEFLAGHRIAGAKYMYDEGDGFWFCFQSKKVYYKLYFYNVDHVERYSGAIIEAFRKK